MKTVDIKGKPYVEVNTRILFFRENFKDHKLLSEIVSLEDGVCIIKASIVNDKNEVIAIGHAYEKEGNGFINKTSYIENCETSAWGRALGNLGVGVDGSVASAEEVGNAILNQDKPTKQPTKTPVKKVKKINMDEIVVIKDLLSEINMDKQVFLKSLKKHINVSELEDIPQVHYARVVNLLEKKKEAANDE